VVAFVLLAAVLGLVATRPHSESPRVSGAPKSALTTAATPIATSRISIGNVSLHNVGPYTPLPRPLRARITTLVRRYIREAIISPLERGRTLPGYRGMFGLGIRPLALERDIRVLTEAGTNFHKRSVRLTASPMKVDVLGTTTGLVGLVATRFRLSIDASTPRGSFADRRATEFTFARERGHWYVTAYRAYVHRAFNHHAITVAAHAG